MKLSEYKNINDLKQLNFEAITSLLFEFRTMILDKISKSGGFLTESLASVESIVALNNELEDNYLFYNDNKTLYTQLIVNGDVKNISDFKISDVENDRIKILNGSVLENLYFIKYFLNNNNNKRVYFYISNHNFTSDEIELLEYLSLKKYNLTIVLLNYKNDKSVFNIQKSISEFRKANFYQNFKKGLAENSNKNYFNKTFFNGFNALKNTVRENIIYKKEFKNIKLNYLLIDNGNNFQEVSLGLKVLKNAGGLCLLNINCIKGFGYSLAKNNPDKFNYIEAFNVETGELKNDYDALEKIRFLDLIRNLNCNVLISKKSYFAKYGAEIELRENIKSLEEISAIIKNNYEMKYFLVLDNLEVYLISKMLKDFKFNTNISFLIYNDDNYYCALESLDDFDSKQLICPKDFDELLSSAVSAVNNGKNIALLYNDIFKSNIKSNLNNNFEWYSTFEKDSNKIIVSNYDYFNHIHKLFESEERICTLINAVNLSDINSTTIEKFNNKEVYIISTAKLAKKINLLLLAKANDKEINIKTKVIICKKRDISNLLKEII